MEKKTKIQLLWCIAGGILITFLTGFIEVTLLFFAGSSWYGFPLPWRYVLVVNPPKEEYNFIFFILDAIFWSLVLYGIIFLLKKEK